MLMLAVLLLNCIALEASGHNNVQGTREEVPPYTLAGFLLAITPAFREHPPTRGLIPTRQRLRCKPFAGDVPELEDSEPNPRLAQFGDRLSSRLGAALEKFRHDMTDLAHVQADESKKRKEKIKKRQSQILETLHDLRHDFLHDIESGIEGLQRGKETLGQSSRRTLQEIGEALKSETKELITGIREGIDAVVEDVEVSVNAQREKLQKDVEAFGKNVKDSVNARRQKLTNDVHSFVDKLPFSPPEVIEQRDEMLNNVDPYAKTFDESKLPLSPMNVNKQFDELQDIVDSFGTFRKRRPRSLERSPNQPIIREQRDELLRSMQSNDESFDESLPQSSMNGNEQFEEWQHTVDSFGTFRKRRLRSVEHTPNQQIVTEQRDELLKSMQSNDESFDNSLPHSSMNVNEQFDELQHTVDSFGKKGPRFRDHSGNQRDDEWIAYADAHGRPYYHNPKTGATAWSLPASTRVVHPPRPTNEETKATFDVGALVQFKILGRWTDGIVTSTEPLKVTYAEFPEAEGYLASVFDGIREMEADSLKKSDSQKVIDLLKIGIKVSPERMREDVDLTEKPS